MLAAPFHGGLGLDSHKPANGPGAIRACPLPGLLAVPLTRHGEAAPHLQVEAGQLVARGQCLARADNDLAIAAHAPCAGTVLAIEMREGMGGGDAIAHVLIRPGEGNEEALPRLDLHLAPPAQLLARVRDAGIAGLGGAGFPSAAKLAVPRDTLILNGVECEPWISCDAALLAERADAVLRGGQVLARIVGASRLVLAIEDDMPAALDACREAMARSGIEGMELVVVPTRYPAGGERQLIQAITGLEVPRGGLPRDLGVVVHNVATAAAAWRAVDLGEPLLRRIVTVTGAGIAHPGNFDVAIGTPISDLVAAAGGYTDRAERLLVGGSMMGVSLPHDGYAITKTSNCILVLGRGQLPEVRNEMPCIRCGDCADACPARLLPQQLHWQLRAGAPAVAVDLGLFDCIECGCCDLACPSAIPLTQQFRTAKKQVRQQQSDAEFAAAARDRHMARQQRLVRDEETELALRATRESESASEDAVAAALARARAKRQGKDGGPPP